MKIKGGYILKARKALESDLMDKPPLWSKLWDWMLLRAEWRPGQRLQRGQFHTTIEDMREAMSWLVGYRRVRPTKDEIRSCYEGLTKATMITTTKATRGMLITISKYEEYQNPKNYEAHSEAHNENSTKPEAGPHDSKEVEEVKNEKRTLSHHVLPSHQPEVAKPTSLDKRLEALSEFVLKFHADRMEQHPTLVTRDLTGPQVNAAVKILDQLIRLDRFDLESQIKPALRWAARDEFWNPQVLSLARLRTRSKTNGLTKMQNILAAHAKFKTKDDPFAGWTPKTKEVRQ